MSATNQRMRITTYLVEENVIPIVSLVPIQPINEGIQFLIPPCSSYALSKIIPHTQKSKRFEQMCSCRIQFTLVVNRVIGLVTEAFISRSLSIKAQCRRI